jgi:hypothetical protein
MPFPLTLTTTVLNHSNLKVVWNQRLRAGSGRHAPIAYTAPTCVVRDTQYPGFLYSFLRTGRISGS